MKVRAFLADAAEVREGLLFILGGAWYHTGPLPTPFAIAGVIEVGWDEANRPHTAEFVIEDVDGNPLLVPTPMGEQPFRLSTPFEVGRPPGSPAGTTLNLPIAIAIPPLPWAAGRHYVLIVRVDDAELDRVRFAVRQAATAPAPPQS